MAAGTLATEYLAQIDQFSDMLAQQVAELDDTRLRRRPGPTLNPPGFIYFHILRIWDLDLNVLIKGRHPREDAWHLAGIGDEMGYSPDGKGGRGAGLGFGYTDQEVDEVPYALEPLRRYHQLLLDDTRAYLESADDGELHREITFRDAPTTVSARLQHIIAHSWNHTGELRMTKSMLGFHDPTTPQRQTS